MVNLMVGGILDPTCRKAKLHAGINVAAVSIRRAPVVENGGEVCLEEEVERLRRSGMSAAEISRTMGVDESWVESLVSMQADEGAPDKDRG